MALVEPQPIQPQFCYEASQPRVLSQIYQPATQMVVWHGDWGIEALNYVESLRDLQSALSLRQILQPQELSDYLQSSLPTAEGKQALIEGISLVGDMFGYLFELDRLGFRLAILEQAMCPKFHRDQVPCRLVCTLRGAATEWLDGKQAYDWMQNPAAESTCHQLQTGHVALLKGKGWLNNEDQGLVHRSPQVKQGDWRLFFSMDFAH